MTKKKYKATHPYAGINAVERRKARREIFIEAGLESFGTIGYVRSTIRGICQTAGLTQRYFYESFQNKEDLLVAVYRKLIQDIEADAMDILAEPGVSAREIAYNMLKMFYNRLQEDPRRAQVQLFEVLGVSTRVNREYQSANIKLADWIKLLVITFFPGLEEQLPKKTIIFTGATGAIIEIANQWVLEDFKAPVDEIAGQAIEAFMILGRHYQDEGQP